MLNLLFSASLISKFFLTVMNSIVSVFLNIETDCISYALFNNYIIDLL